jgi:multifunctional 2-oxoglutarate metabolism enzyme
VIVNNQVGFTTGAGLGRPTHYSSDLAKWLGCPTIHVNADSPEVCSISLEMVMTNCSLSSRML